MRERYELATARIREIREELRDAADASTNVNTLAIEKNETNNFSDIEKYREYLLEVCDMFLVLEEVFQAQPDDSRFPEWNERLNRSIAGDAYEKSFGNPSFCAARFGKQEGSCLCWLFASFRLGIPAAYEKDGETLLHCMELFLQVYTILTDEDEKARSLKEAIYYFVHDYDEEQMEKSIRLDPEGRQSAYIRSLVMDSDLSDPAYLYRYGEYVTENEIRMARFLYSLPEDTLAEMARTYTEGYRKGFEIAGIDLSQKKTVQIRYHIGFEALVRPAVEQFRAMGLEPVFRHSFVTSTSPNRQYPYDHRYDDALYLNKAFVSRRLDLAEHIYEKNREEAAAYAGPAVIEVFGEKLFVPTTKKESLSYTKEQEKLSVEYRRDFSLLTNRYIPQDSYSFTIIAYPMPEIGEQFEDIFRDTVKVNTLDAAQYQRIQQALIDALDQGEYVRVTGRGANHTDVRIQLHALDDPDRQTNFENCLADVNIPVGEVFTSPVLKGTEGVLHVTQVYLNELRYENLEIVLKDGMVKEYRCSNYETEEENTKYIKENVLYNRETLPVGEFAIGTNTTAYTMGRRYGIEAKLPILIAEKTGPHFALGDTCYSMSEDVVLHNPDGKEIIAKENECSALRNTEPEKAYFNCHTDITIPYDELGDIQVFTKEGKTITLLREGRFVLPGTEALNEALMQ